MKKPMKKGVKIFLILLIVGILMAICFLSVALYAKNEFEKEKSWIPPKFSPQEASVTELPDNAGDAYEYVMRLYNEALHSDRVEGSWHTDVDLGGEMVLPFTETDNQLINEIRSEAGGAIQALYPNVSGVKMSDEKSDELPEIDLQESEIIEYYYDPSSVFNRKGEYNSDTYEIAFKVDPAFEKPEEILQSDVYKGVCEALKDAVTVKNAELNVKDVEIRFRVDRLTDQIQSVDVARSYDVVAQVTLTDAYSALAEAPGTRDLTVTVPYKATEKISFMWYGVRFRVNYLEQKPNDMITLPLDIRVNSSAVQGEDFTVDYIISDPETLEIDKDAVMTVKKTDEVSATEGIHVTASLQFEGNTYTDDVLVYITDLDKTVTGVRFWEDSFTIAVGEIAPMPVDIRVPVNEQSEQKTEEEYELFIEISDPDALTIEVDGKDLYASALKAVSSPVTVSMTMKCGGHTYQAEIPVTITEGTEATKNG